jgi:hypothetical protein
VNGVPILGDGSNEDHLQICATSKALLQFASKPGMKHIDCTYKILKNGFSLLVFGVTDFEHAMLFSHDASSKSAQ